MPQGNSQFLPSGIWSFGPTTASVPRLFLRTCRNLTGFIFVCYLLSEWRVMQSKKVYNRFVGRTMTLGTLNTDTHEPLSVEEIDKLKAAEAERKRLKKKQI